MPDPIISPDGVPAEPIVPVTPEVVPEVTPAEATPVEETPEAPEVNLNDFIEAIGKPLSVTPSEEPPTTPTDDTKPEGEIEEVSPAAPKLTRKELVEKDKATRDVKDFADDKDLSEYLAKDMSRKAFEKIKPLLIEAKAAKASLAELQKQHEDLKKTGPQLPESYYEHERGFLLDPEFAIAARDVNENQQILNHWEKQLDEIAQGAKEFDFLDRDPKTGQLVITGKVPADRLSEVKLQKYINYAQNLVTNSQGNLKAVMQMHSQKHQARVGNVQKFIGDTFGAFDKPENKPIYEPLIKEKMDMFKEFSGNPILPLLARSLVMNQALAKFLKDAATEKEATKVNGGNGTKTKPKPTAGPSGDEIAGDGGKSGKGEATVTWDDFNAVKAGV